MCLLVAAALSLTCDAPITQPEREESASQQKATSLEVVPSEAAGEPGTTIQFEATVVDANGRPISGYSVNWSSSNTDLVTVDHTGLATIQDSGSATLNATTTSEDDTELTSSATVKGQGAKATNVEISLSEATLEEGESVQLDAIVRDAQGDELDRHVTWSSSDSEVASVDKSGVLTGQSEGTSDVEAKSGSARDTIRVEVTASSVSVAGVDVDPESVVTVKGDTVRLKATVTDEGGNEVDHSVTWSSNDIGVASVDSEGVVTGTAPGTAHIQATAGSETDSAEVLVEESSTTSLDIDTTVSSLSPSSYELGTLMVGAQFYVDREYTVQEVPDALEEWTLIRTANEDKDATAEDAISFELSDSVTVAIAYDEIRATSLPGWLEDWQATGDTLVTDDPGEPRLPIRVQAFGPGTVILGANLSDGAEGAESMYVPLVGDGISGGDDGGGETTSVATVEVSPDSAGVAVGSTTQYSATALDADGNTISDISFTWSSSDSVVVTVDGDGTATGQSAGTTSIYASADGHSDQAFVTVSDAASTGTLEVVTSTTGSDLDPDGYTVEVEGGSSDAVGVNDTLTYPDLPVGGAEVRLWGIASNCEVSSSNPRTVDVPEDDTVSTTFEIGCTTVEGADPVWTDDFESGGFNYAASNEDTGWDDRPWAGPDNIEVNEENPYSGAYSMRVRFPDSGDLNADGEWPDGTGGVNVKAHYQVDHVKEMWMEFYLYVPDNYKHAEQATKSQNRKFWVIWDEDRRDEHVSVYNELFPGNEDTQVPVRSSKFRLFLDTDHGIAGEGGSWWSDGGGHGCGVTPCLGDVLRVEDRGSWIRLRYHVKLSSQRGVDDGQFHVWRNDTLVMQEEALSLYPSETGNFYLHHGQIFGAQNSPYDEETKFYLDDFKIYDHDPGW